MRQFETWIYYSSPDRLSFKSVLFPDKILAHVLYYHYICTAYSNPSTRE